MKNLIVRKLSLDQEIAFEGNKRALLASNDKKLKAFFKEMGIEYIEKDNDIIIGEVR
jgi:hypothetical protein